MKKHHPTTTAELLGLTLLCAALCIAGPAAAQSIDDCIECHMDRTLTKVDDDGTVHSLFVDKGLYLRSIHGQEGYTCIDCHGDATIEHPAEGLEKVSCVDCHEDVAEKFAQAPHGKLLAEGNTDAPECQDCHGIHTELPPEDPASSIHPDNLAATCGACHPGEARPPLPRLARAFVQGESADVPQPPLHATLLSLIPSRLRGHGKVTISCDFSTQRCNRCHYETASHGNPDLQPEECAACHSTDRSRLLFGTIHKSVIVRSPLLMTMLGLLYLIAIAGLVFYFRGRRSPEPPPSDTEQ